MLRELSFGSDHGSVCRETACARIVEDHRLELIEQHLAWHAAEIRKRRLELTARAPVVNDPAAHAEPPCAQWLFSTGLGRAGDEVAREFPITTQAACLARETARMVRATSGVTPRSAWHQPRVPFSPVFFCNLNPVLRFDHGRR